MSFRHFTHAIVRGVPNSMAGNAVGLNGQVDLEKAKMQHNIYVSTLREVGLEIIELPPDENYPDCVFVEDTAVVCNGTALVSKPGHPSRRKEADYMRSILKNELGLQISEIEDPAATLDGGDVLFTGKEFFVGLSGRTNQAGINAIASTFSEFPCVTIKVDKALHLTNLIGMAGPDLMCVDPSAEGRDTYSRLQKAANFQYQTLDLPEVGVANGYPANVVLVNGTLLHRTTEELPKLANIFQEQLSHLNLKPINISEFRKANGNLTCCSILIHKSET